MNNYETQYSSKTEISDTIEMLIDKINTVKGVYASIYISGDGSVTINIYPWDTENEEE